jgi:hypothetical protein
VFDVAKFSIRTARLETSSSIGLEVTASPLPVVIRGQK